ncbi:MAG: hypothetical protein J5712_07195 [Lachnospiraceae bacterium]|nr:hypothetical protein [Lachnospiraceae bacterium]MBR5733819.1 hypothetical protein [Lachnospiraceae bacterium]
MTGLEITLFILGAAFIIISFFIVGGNERSAKDAVRSALDANVLEQMHEDFVEKANKRADFLLHETEDKLESLSNDKIIAVGEYSDQMLEKIESNHKEVVFLYQMLNEKEEALKATALGMENTRIACEKMIRDAEATREAVDKAAAAAENRLSAVLAKPQAAKSPEPARTAPAPQPAPAKPAARPAGTAAKPAGTAAAKPAGTTAAKTASSGTAAKPAARPAAKAPAARPAATINTSVFEAPTENLDTGAINRNDEIIALHKSGKSVMEISKLLGMGQGEVKLIIDLYC